GSMPITNRRVIITRPTAPVQTRPYYVRSRRALVFSFLLLTPNLSTPVELRNLRNAAVLTLSQVSKLVNLPVAQDVVRHIHQITVALKPSVLQAPKTNDLTAKELADHVTGLLEVLDAVLPHLDDTAELDALYDRLQTARAELESIQASEYTTNLASQTRIQDRIAQLKEEVYCTVLDLTLRLLVMTVSQN
ncbi:hypothetical protein V565_185860, partial [Rhizoctonia solani 123E]